MSRRRTFPASRVERTSHTGKTDPLKILLAEEARAEFFAGEDNGRPLTDADAALAAIVERYGPHVAGQWAWKAWKAHHNPSTGQGGKSARAAADALFEGA